MSLMRLLSVSRSFCAHIPEMGRYKMARRGALPKFGGLRRAVALEATTTQAELPMPPAAPEAPLKASEASAQGMGLAEGPRFRLDGADSSPASGSVSAPATERAASAPGWWSGLWGWLRRACQGWLVPARPRRSLGRPPVQTAFPLESIRVVRNDLSEGDFELVTPRKTPGRAHELARAADGADRPEVDEPTWGRTAMRWLAGTRNGP
jgi:hypothetical protein